MGATRSLKETVDGLNPSIELKFFQVTQHPSWHSYLLSLVLFSPALLCTYLNKLSQLPTGAGKSPCPDEWWNASPVGRTRKQSFRGKMVPFVGLWVVQVPTAAALDRMAMEESAQKSMAINLSIQDDEDRVSWWAEIIDGKHLCKGIEVFIAEGSLLL